MNFATMLRSSIISLFLLATLSLYSCAQRRQLAILERNRLDYIRMQGVWADIKAERKSNVNRIKSIEVVACATDGRSPGILLFNSGTVDTTIVEASRGTMLRVSDPEFICLTAMFEQNLQRLVSAPDSIKTKKKFPFAVYISTASVDTTIYLANSQLTAMLLRGVNQGVANENIYLTTKTKEHLHKFLIYNANWIDENR